MASEQLPGFPDRNPIEGGRAWTAVFDSYDQRNDDCYYLVTLFDGESVVSQLMAQVGMWWAGDDWTSAEFLERLRKEIHSVAATGKSNTEYRGSLAGSL